MDFGPTFNHLIGTLKPQGKAMQYSDWYTLGCGPLNPLLAVPNVTAHSPTASVPTSYYSM